MKYGYLSIDAKRLVEKLGGVPAVQQMLTDEGFRPLPERNVYKWYERRSISSSRVLELLHCIDKRKLKVRLTDFTEPTTTEMRD